MQTTPVPGIEKPDERRPWITPQVYRLDARDTQTGVSPAGSENVFHSPVSISFSFHPDS